MNFNELELEKFNNIYIYGFGLSGKWLSDNLPTKNKFFVDTDQKKSGRKHNNIEVIDIKAAKKIIKKDDLILLTPVDIQDVVPIMDREFKEIKWKALGIFLNGSDTESSVNNSEENMDFVKYSLSAVEKCHKAYISKNKLFLRSVDIVISERCSLKCKDCSNLMQYYLHPKNFTFEQIKKEFEELTSNISHIFEIRLIGGEPFMNKEIYDIIDYFLDNKKITKLVIYSNGTIPLKKDRIKNYNKTKLVFTITDYGNLSKNTDKVCKELEDNNVTTRRHPPENWTDSAQIVDFNRSKNEMEELFDVCCGKNLLTSMNGKLYRCPFVANAESLRAIPLDERNSVSVSASPEDIQKYTRDIKYLPACNFCKGRSFDASEITPAIQTKKPLEYKKFNY